MWAELNYLHSSASRPAFCMCTQSIKRSCQPQIKPCAQISHLIILIIADFTVFESFDQVSMISLKSASISASENKPEASFLSEYSKICGPYKTHSSYAYTRSSTPNTDNCPSFISDYSIETRLKIMTYSFKCRLVGLCGQAA